MFCATAVKPFRELVFFAREYSGAARFALECKIASAASLGLHGGLPIMVDEKIKVKVTDTGQVLEVVVLNKRAERIQVVLGEGIHSVKCDLSPTRNGMGYAGSAMGRELIYERSRDQVQADIDRVNPALRKSR